MKSFFLPAVASARKTDRHYKAIDAPSTQNVRNPLPLRDIVRGILPQLPAKTVTVKQTIVVKAHGTITHVPIEVDLPPQAFWDGDEDFLANNAMSLREAADIVVATGWLVNSLASVRSAIESLPGVAKVKLPKTKSGAGRREIGYYLPS